MNFTYYYTLNYLPTRYEASSSEWNARRAVWNFKDGYCSEEVFMNLKKTVDRIVGSDSKDDYVICFIPASSRDKTQRRFATVAMRLETKTGISATLEAITKPVDTASGHIYGKTSNPTSGFSFNDEYFSNKRVILIDDVITRGTTFHDTAIKLMHRGAKSVVGLFVAKTVSVNHMRA